MLRSGQKLGFNPKDHDGIFTGLPDEFASVSGVRPDVCYDQYVPPKEEFKKWRIYPKPPPPHWHWKGPHTVPSHAGSDQEDEEFEFEQCEIPEPDNRRFALDEKGVYQVYESEDGRERLILLLPSSHDTFVAAETPAFDIPSIREYFMDLEYVLGVIADGPTKSFAFRRLNYLASKFTMYSLLNETQELADMKVSHGYTYPKGRLMKMCRGSHIGS